MLSHVRTGKRGCIGKKQLGFLFPSPSDLRFGGSRGVQVQVFLHSFKILERSRGSQG